MPATPPKDRQVPAIVRSLVDNRSPDSLASKMRGRRMARLRQLLQSLPEPVRILDIGGTPEIWLHNLPTLRRECQLTFVNVRPVDPSAIPGARALVGDARRLEEIPDASFDLVFSNSVIEHVGTLYDQWAMAREVRRIGKAYFVQTPNRYFPLEPHYLVPFWQFLPLWFRAALSRRARLGWMSRQPDWLIARAEVEQVRLLTRREFQGLFPDAAVVPERLGPLVKSFMAIRGPGAVAGREDPRGP